MKSKKPAKRSPTITKHRPAKRVEIPDVMRRTLEHPAVIAGFASMDANDAIAFSEDDDDDEDDA